MPLVTLACWLTDDHRFPYHEHWMLLITGSYHWRMIWWIVTRSRCSNTIMSSSLNCYHIHINSMSLDHEITLITFTGKVLWLHQTSLHNWVIIKVSSGTWKVLVEARGSRVGFFHPDYEEIYSGPSRWYHINIDCKQVIWSLECYIMGMRKWVLVGNNIKLGMDDNKWSDLR